MSEIRIPAPDRGPQRPVRSGHSHAVPNHNKAATVDDKAATVVERARSHVRQPWHDKGPGPYCASFVRQVFLEAGLTLDVAKRPSDWELTRHMFQGPTWANSLAGDEIGEKIDSAERLKAGDLVFWSGTDPKYPRGVITHVGIFVGNGRVIDRGDARVEERPLSTFRHFVEGRRPSFTRRGAPADFIPAPAATGPTAVAAAQLGVAATAAIRAEAEGAGISVPSIDTVLRVIAKAQSYVPQPWKAPHAGSYCASFVRQVFSDVGIRLGVAAKPSDAQFTRGMQAGPTYANSLAGDEIGIRIRLKSDLAPGDIVFWERTSREFGPGIISHVGLYVGDSHIIDRGDRAVQRRPLSTFMHFVEGRRVRM